MEGFGKRDQKLPNWGVKLVLVANYPPKMSLESVTNRIGSHLGYLTDMARAALVDVAMKKAVNMVSSEVR